MSLGCAGAADGQKCGFGQQTGEAGECCGGRCTDPQTDPNNCGACGFGTPGGTCVNGAAFPFPAEAGICAICDADDECYGPYCVDPACVLGGVCFTDDGRPAACCPNGDSPQVCADVANDPLNCGGCGFACPVGQTCADGQCSGTQPACGPGLVEGYCNLDAGPSYLCCPGGGCTNTLTDPGNCGACGLVCDGGCAAGSCT
jgi:hypothetical protein